jgi:hypothetical protein
MTKGKNAKEDSRFEQLSSAAEKNSASNSGNKENPSGQERDENDNEDFLHSSEKMNATQVSHFAKSTNPDYTRASVYLPKTLHKSLKNIATSEEMTLTDLIEGILQQWVDKRQRKN